MAYGTVKVDNIVFDDGGSDQTVTVSGLYNSLTSGITVTGTISGAVVIGSTSVSGTTVAGVTVTGTTVQGASGTFTSLTGTTIQGTTATYTTGSFTSLTGTTTTGTTANFVSGVFTTSVSGTTVIAPTGTFTSLTGTTTQGTTATYTTGSFTSLTGTTTTGTTLSFTSGVFTTLSGATATFTSGIIASGTAAAPSLAILGDPDTGVFSPGANQLAVATNGTGRLFVDASGNVGVSTSPTAKLEVSRLGPAWSGPAVIAGTALFLHNGSATASSSTHITLGAGNASASQIYFADTDSNNVGIIGYDHAADFLRFTVNSSERLRITSAGNVGIGTSAPDTKLQVFSGTVNTDVLKLTGTVGGRGLVVSTFASTADDDSAAFNAQSASGHLALRTGGNDRLRITQTGNVGIGTTSPGRKLEVTSSEDTAILSRSTDTKSYIQFVETGSSRYIGNNNNNIVFLTGTAAEQARIDSSGRLLVGTSTARSNFNSSNTPQIQLEGVNYNTSALSIVRNSSGSLLGGAILLGKTRSASSGNAVVSDGDVLGTVDFQGADGSNLIPGARIEARVDGTPGANDMPGRLVFSTTADGASSPTERMRISNDGRTDAFATSETLRVRTAATTAAAAIAIRLQAGATSITAGGTTEFQVTSNGNVANTNNSYGAISDIKLKENIVDANSQWDDIKALQVRNYNFKEGQTHTQIGLVAQEVELVSPGLVSESPDRDEDGNDLGTVTKNVNYSVLYMKAVKALQEAMERIEQLEAKVAALESA